MTSVEKTPDEISADGAIGNDTGLSKLQQVALDSFREANGRNWKTALLKNWERASYPGVLDPDHAAALHQLRNTLGPDWLMKYRKPEPNSHPIPNDPTVQMVVLDGSGRAFSMGGWKIVKREPDGWQNAYELHDEHGEHKTYFSFRDSAEHDMVRNKKFEFTDEVTDASLLTPNMAESIRKNLELEWPENGPYVAQAMQDYLEAVREASTKTQLPKYPRYVAFTIENTQTAAFADIGRANEIKRILVEAKEHILANGIGAGFSLRDINGNVVGRVDLNDDYMKIEPLELPAGGFRVGFDLISGAFDDGNDRDSDIANAIDLSIERFLQYGGSGFQIYNEKKMYLGGYAQPVPDDRILYIKKDAGYLGTELRYKGNLNQLGDPNRAEQVLSNIKTLLEEANNLFGSLSRDDQDVLTDFYHGEGSIALTLRNGLKVAEDLIDTIQVIRSMEIDASGYEP